MYEYLVNELGCDLPLPDPPCCLQLHSLQLRPFHCVLVIFARVALRSITVNAAIRSTSTIRPDQFTEQPFYTYSPCRCLRASTHLWTTACLAERHALRLIVFEHAYHIIRPQELIQVCCFPN